MQAKVVGDLDARLDALAARIEASLDRARVWVERSESRLEDGARAAYEAELRDAEARALLQAQRCQALEARVIELETALVGAREERARAVAAAESARQQTEQALDQLEAVRRHGGAPSLDNELSQTLQTKLLEVERLTSELVALRRSNDDWRGRARKHRRELDRVSAELDKTSSQLSELQARDDSSSKRLADLERLVGEQRRELELAERRAKHLRQHIADTNQRP